MMIKGYSIIEPSSVNEFRDYYNLRWRVLRQPWGKLKGSERDESDKSAIHRMIINSEDSIVAVGRMHYNSNIEAQIRYMAVKKDFQNMSFGGHLLRYFESLAKDNGITQIILHAREEAIDFYIKNGFFIVEKSYLLFDSIQHFLMKKRMSI